MAKTKCLKCKTVPATINYLCLSCDEKWQDRKREIREVEKREWTLDDMFRWVSN